MGCFIVIIFGEYFIIDTKNKNKIKVKHHSSGRYYDLEELSEEYKKAILLALKNNN